MSYGSQDGDAHLVGRRVLAGTDYYVLETSEGDGMQRQHFIHPQSWLVERSRETKALHPDISPTQINTEEHHSRFQPLCGVRRSYMTESYDLATKELIQSTEVLEGSCNIDDAELDLARPQGN